MPHGPSVDAFRAASDFVLNEDGDAAVVHCCITDPLTGVPRVHAWNEVHDPYDGWLVVDRSRGDAIMGRKFFYGLNGVRKGSCRRYGGRAEVEAMRAGAGGRDGPWEVDAAPCRGGR